MRKTFLAIAILFSVSVFGQGTSVKQDTAKQEAISKFVETIVTKTSIADFKKWVYENLPAKKNDEFLVLYRYFINQKYAESKNK
jgi:hypothetical protein